MISRIQVFSLFALVMLAAPCTLHAYSDPSQFNAPALAAGGGGRFYTGSPADSYGCNSCHTGGEPPTAHVFGVPARYVPRATYEFVVSWPSSIVHASLALELTDEAGHGAGNVALPGAGTYVDAEQCQPADGTLLAAQLYAAAPDRTIVAAPDCGASSVRVQWTAPSKSVGPVWLAFGVLSSNHDGNFTGDGVTQFTQAIPPFGETTSSQLTAGCDVAIRAARKRRAPAPAECLCAALLTLAGRRRRRCSGRGVHLRAVIACAALIYGCNDEHAGSDTRNVVVQSGAAVMPWRGAQRLVFDAGAADGGEQARRDADGGGVVDASVAELAPTRLSFQVTTLTQSGDYEPKNIGAIWIEDDAGHWIKTLAVWASTRARYLVAYNAVNPTHNKVDAVTSATLAMHTTHDVTWDLHDASGVEVANGDYRVRVEVTDWDGSGHAIAIDFEKSDQLFNSIPSDQPYFSDMQLRMLAGDATP